MPFNCSYFTNIVASVGTTENTVHPVWLVSLCLLETHWWFPWEELPYPTSVLRHTVTTPNCLLSNVNVCFNSIIHHSPSLPFWKSQTIKIKWNRSHGSHSSVLMCMFTNVFIFLIITSTEYLPMSPFQAHWKQHSPEVDVVDVPLPEADHGIGSGGQQEAFWALGKRWELRKQWQSLTNSVTQMISKSRHWFYMEG